MINAIQNAFLASLRASLKGENYELELGNEGDLSEFFKLCTIQSLLPICIESVLDSKCFDSFPAIKIRNSEEAINQTVRQAASQIDFFNIYNKLLYEGIKPIAVKGLLCEKLYSIPFHRTSSDFDILINESELDLCNELLTEKGLTSDYDPESGLFSHEVSYYNLDKSFCIELHTSLFSKSDELRFDFNGFFSDAVLSPVKIDGVYTLNYHAHLLYLVIHAFKHFITTGFGLRQAVDIGLWIKNYNDSIDWTLLFEQLERVNATNFMCALLKIIVENLEIEIPIESIPDFSHVDSEPLLTDMLIGGIHGASDLTRLHSSTMTLNAFKNGKASPLKSLFPKRNDLVSRYPFLKKHPYLIPIAWGNRIVKYIFENLSGKTDSPAKSIEISQQRLKIMEFYGILQSERK